MDVEVRVKEVMTQKVITVTPNETVDNATKLMAEKDIGCVIVVENGRPTGIVTERNICYGVAASNRLASEVEVKEIMSSPLHTIEQDKTLIEAAKIMAKKNFRRLPVVEGEKLIGIITNKDITAISPRTIEILREINDIYERGGPSTMEMPEKGICELCGDFTVALYDVDGKFLCEDCRDDSLGGE
ncbi:MAG: cyclic nucleotide-binding/CBS domain-containing protein [Candidatus Hydrothermarchaeales archaeon]